MKGVKAQPTQPEVLIPEQNVIAPNNDTIINAAANKFQQITGTKLNTVENKQSPIKTLNKGDEVLISTEQTHVHLIPIEDLFTELQANPNGISQEARQQKLKNDGYNQITESKKHWAIYYFFTAQIELFSGLLWVAIIICLVVYGISVSQGITGNDYNLYLAIALICLNVFSGIMQMIQHIKSERQVQGFQQLLPQQSIIISNGVETQIESKLLVVGDICVLKAGMKCPADMRLIQQDQLKADFSGLTGEAEPVERTLVTDQKVLLRAENCLFSGAGITQGAGRGIVFAVGDKTQLGLQKKQVDKSGKKKEAVVEKEIKRLVVFITVASIAIGVIFFGLSMAFGIGVIPSFIFAIGIIVANVPEGLSLAITVALGSAAHRLFKKKMLTKSLQDVATLGSISVICSDKTGTITQNKMTVQSVYCSGVLETVNWQKESCNCQVDEIVQFILTVNSKAQFDEGDSDKNVMTRSVLGDASEAAILRFMNVLDGSQLQTITSNIKRLQAIPFNSQHKFQLCEVEYQGHRVITVKGAAERIIKLCKTALIGKDTEDMNEDLTKEISEAIESRAKRGERVLGLAYTRNIKDDVTVENVTNGDLELVFAGFVSMQDPPKPGVLEAVNECHTASIRVVMVTGDHHLTAVAIAKQVNIITQGVDEYLDKAVDLPDVEETQVAGCRRSDEYDVLVDRISRQSVDFFPKSLQRGAVITGEYLETATAQQLLCLVMQYEELVFARTTPIQKLKIVNAYQQFKKIVAATGDGLNDAPALKQANVGVAMASGSEIARDAANIVLINDSFASIVDAVKEGRLIFDNLKKSMSYAITTTIPELTPFLLFVICGFPNALSPIVIILIDIATSIWPAFALGYEDMESDLMKKPPNNHKEHMFSKQLCVASYGICGVWQAACLIITFILVVQYEALRLVGSPLPLSAFASMQHLDFETVTLLEFVKKNPSLVSRAQEVATQIFWAGQTASFMSIVQTQLVHAFVGRTRINSLFKTKFNWYTLGSIFIMMAFALAMIYVPVFQPVLHTQSLLGIYWVINLPLMAIMLIYEEVRKLILRKSDRTGKLFKVLYW